MIKEKYFAFVAAIIISLTLVSCKTKENAESTEKHVKEISQVSESTEEPMVTDEVEETDESLATDEVEESNDPTEASNNSEFHLQNDGNYFGSIYSARQGRLENSLPSVYATVSKGDILQVSGSLSFGHEDYSTPEDEILENRIYIFEVDENTEYKAVSGLADPMIMTPEEFNDYFEEVNNSGLGLIIKVENGIVREVTISS